MMAKNSVASQMSRRRNRTLANPKGGFNPRSEISPRTGCADEASARTRKWGRVGALVELHGIFSHALLGYGDDGWSGPPGLEAPRFVFRVVSSHAMRPTVRTTRIQPAVSRFTKSHPTKLSAAINQMTATYREISCLIA
jgi:hypothetical protein